MAAKRKGEGQSASNIYVGVGGWTFEPWRGVFYPPDLPKARELEYAGEHLTAIEINGTFYRAQGPKSFAKWRDETPENFVFAVKGHRAVVNKKKLAEAGETLEWFLGTGLTELGTSSGRSCGSWRRSRNSTRRISAPSWRCCRRRRTGCRSATPSRCGMQASATPRFVDLARKHNVAIVYAESDDYPAIADDTADFAYARLMRSSEEEPIGYPDVALDEWAERARVWAKGGFRRTCRALRRSAERRRKATRGPSISSSSPAPR